MGIFPSCCLAIKYNFFLSWMNSCKGGSTFGYKSMFVILHKAATFLCWSSQSLRLWCKDFQYKMWSKLIVWFLSYQMTKKIIIDYSLKGVGWMAKVSPLKHLYALITMLSPWGVHRNSSMFQTTAFLIHPKRVAIDYLV